MYPRSRQLRHRHSWRYLPAQLISLFLDVALVLRTGFRSGQFRLGEPTRAVEDRSDDQDLRVSPPDVASIGNYSQLTEAAPVMIVAICPFLNRGA